MARKPFNSYLEREAHMKTRSATSNARRTLLRKVRDLLRSVSRGRGKASRAADVMDLLDQKERELLSSIHLALEKIERGIFGICDGCSERISEERLEVKPWELSCPPCAAAAKAGPAAEDASCAALEL